MNVKHEYYYTVLDTETGNQWENLRSREAAEIVGGVKYMSEYFKGLDDTEITTENGRYCIWRSLYKDMASTKIADLKAANGLEWFRNFCDEWNRLRRIFGVMT